MARIEREQDRVVDSRSLDFEIKALAQALSQRESQAAVDPYAARRMNHYLRAAESVEEPFYDQRVLVGYRAQRRYTSADIVDHLFRGVLLQRTFLDEPSRRRRASGPARSVRG